MKTLIIVEPFVEQIRAELESIVESILPIGEWEILTPSTYNQARLLLPRLTGNVDALIIAISEDPATTESLMAVTRARWQSAKIILTHGWHATPKEQERRFRRFGADASIYKGYPLPATQIKATFQYLLTFPT